jgi:DNA-binding NarL/FixJ family response regulator
MPPLRVLIVEDHELARYGLSMALEDKGGLTLVGEADNGQVALEMARQLLPDVVLMDIGMPVMDGITATQQLKAAIPEIKVVMLTSHKDEEEVYAALAAGADAYCMKDIKVERLCQVLAMIMDGAVWLDPEIARLVMQAIKGPHVTRDTKKLTVCRKRYNTDLTEREQEVLQLIVDGYSNKEIAQRLNVTTHTAKAHVCNIIQKLAVDDRTQAAVRAIREGLVQQD